MFHNYFYLKRLAQELNEELRNFTLLTCFSQNKDELILGLANGSNEFWIRANLSSNISLISFPSTFYRAGKNSIDLFGELIEKRIAKVEEYKYERSFVIYFNEGHSLIFKLHARRSNVLLAKDGKVISIFRNSLEKDFNIIPDKLNKEIEISKESFFNNDFSPNRLIPALGKEFQKYWDDNFGNLNHDEKWSSFSDLIASLNHNPIRLINSNPPAISLLNLVEYEKAGSALAAANWLYENTSRGYHLQLEKTRLIAKLRQQIKQSENYISKTQHKLNEVASKRNPEEIANIIMANLNIIQPGLGIVTLNDFYTNNFIEIKLNPRLSAQKNAENLYRKAKNRHQEIDNLEENIKTKEILIEKLSSEITFIEEISDHKELRKITKKEKTNKNSNKDAVKSYHEFEKDGWLVLVGKNAKANDQLTLRIATKNDLWLHAKDVSGSHVVIKQKPGQNFPDHLIEFAASIAAYYSKRKTETLCPVIYTLKKYVRKTKGSAPGEVIVEKEDVVLIEPQLPKLTH